MITIVVYREDHANNLRLKACLLSYNLHVRFLFEMKKKKNKRNAQPTYVPIFSRRQTAGGVNFYRNFVFYIQKMTFQGISSIVMDVLLLLSVVRFCNVK